MPGRHPTPTSMSCVVLGVAEGGQGWRGGATVSGWGDGELGELPGCRLTPVRGAGGGLALGGLPGGDVGVPEGLGEHLGLPPA